MAEKLSHWSCWFPSLTVTLNNQQVTENFFLTIMEELSSEIRKEAERKLERRVPLRMFRKKIKAKFRLNKGALIFPQRLHAEEAWHLNFFLQDFCLPRLAIKAPNY